MNLNDLFVELNSVFPTDVFGSILIFIGEYSPNSRGYKFYGIK